MLSGNEKSTYSYSEIRIKSSDDKPFVFYEASKYSLYTYIHIKALGIITLHHERGA